MFRGRICITTIVIAVIKNEDVEAQSSCSLCAEVKLRKEIKVRL